MKREQLIFIQKLEYAELSLKLNHLVFYNRSKTDLH